MGSDLRFCRNVETICMNVGICAYTLPMETTITKEITMSNQITVNLEWETNESGMYFTTVFGTVKKTWEQIVGPIFGFEVNHWTTDEEIRRFAETFTVKSYSADENETTVIVNAKYIGTVTVTASEWQEVQVWVDDELTGQASFSKIINA